MLNSDSKHPKIPQRFGWPGFVLTPLALLLIGMFVVFLPSVPAPMPALTAAPVPVQLSASDELTTFLPNVQKSYEPAITPQVTGPLSNTTYLPSVNRYRAPRQSVFGVQVLNGSGVSLAKTAAEAGATWIRYGEIYWNEIEAVRGQRDWSSLASFDLNLAALQAQGLNTQVIVLGAPAWAQRRVPWQCSAIREDALNDFATFMQALVKRYSGAPYYIKYWELGNEPDVDPSFVGSNSGFGCWGDLGDPYYGGGYYATMLRTVYPAIKAIDPQAKVMIGGLLMDCDPTHPPADSTDGCRSGKFFEGILRGGGADYFDIVAYHAYNHWNDNGLDADLTHPKWAARGGALLGKTSLLREVMARYGVNKPLLMNEGGVLCHPSNTICPNDAFRQDQAMGMVKLMARSWANGIEGAIWYTLNGPGWREGGLLEADDTPLPAYRSLKFLGNLLKSAHFTNSTTTAQTEMYEFEDNAHIYRLYWTNNDGLTIQIPVTMNIQTIYNVYGQSITSGASTIPVSSDPVIVVLGK